MEKIFHSHILQAIDGTWGERCYKMSKEIVSQAKNSVFSTFQLFKVLYLIVCVYTIVFKVLVKHRYLIM